MSRRCAAAMSPAVKCEMIDRWKMSLQSWHTFSNFLLVIGPLVAALGGFGKWYFTSKIKASPPEVRIHSVTPVMVYDTIEWTVDPNKKVNFMKKGISLVVNTESMAKSVTISRLKAKGKLFISPNMYISQDDHAGRGIKELYQEWEDRKPYVNVNWTAYIDEGKSNNTLNSFDTKLICFNLIDLIVGGQPESGWEVPFSDYIGYLNGSKEPDKTRSYPEFDFFFKTNVGEDFPYDIRDEIKNGDIEFAIIAGNQEIPITYSSFKKPKLFRKKYWDESPLDKIMFRDK